VATPRGAESSNTARLTQVNVDLSGAAGYSSGRTKQRRRQGDAISPRQQRLGLGKCHPALRRTGKVATALTSNTPGRRLTRPSCCPTTRWRRVLHAARRSASTLGHGNRAGPVEGRQAAMGGTASSDTAVGRPKKDDRRCSGQGPPRRCFAGDKGTTKTAAKTKKSGSRARFRVGHQAVPV